MAGFGFSVGDILACGKLCHQLYHACFSEAGDAIATWKYLGRELFALGTALKTLSLDDNIIPSQLNVEKEQRALEAVRMVVGDFKETLRELEAMLMKFDDFGEAGGGRQYWMKVKFSVGSATGELEKFRTRIAMHTRAVNLLLNPLIYQQMKGMQTSQNNIQTSVTNIHARIDTIDQVLQALLFVASEQLTSSPRVSNSTRITAVGSNDGNRRSKPQHLIEASPMNIHSVLGLLPAASSGAVGSSRQIKAEEMIRSTSHPPVPAAQISQSNRQEGSSGIRRSTTEPHDNIQPSSFYKTAVSGPDRRTHGFNHKVHEDRDVKQKGKQIASEGSSFYDGLPSPKPQRKASVDLYEANENPINAALKKQAESNEAQYIPIEHWITAAMHWYFKAESELDGESDKQEVSTETYLGLMKSTWIVENVIRKWDSEAELTWEVRKNVETLIVLIVDKFRRMESRKMPDIRQLDSRDFEIWHEDIKEILVKPTSPLTSSIRSMSRESTIKGPSWPGLGEEPPSPPPPPPPRKQSIPQPGHSTVTKVHHHRISVSSPESDYDSPPVRSSDRSTKAPRIEGDVHEELVDWNRWRESILTPSSGSSSQHNPVGAPEDVALSPKHDTFIDWPSSVETTSHSPFMSGSSFSDEKGNPGLSHVRRSPSVSTASTGSSGRRESLNSQYPTSITLGSSPVPIPVRRKPLPPIIRPRVMSEDLNIGGLNISGIDQRSRHSSFSEVDESSEFVEMIGERLVLDAIPVLWASRSAGPFTNGILKIFWNESHEYFRLFTAWSGGRCNSQDISLRSTDLVPAYAYEQDPILFLRKVNQRLPASSNVLSSSPSVGNEISRRGYVYKFLSSEEMLKFQATLTGEDIYQDLVKRVSAVKFKRSSEKGGHTYHDARLQLWHEKPPSDSLLPDTASGFTGMSKATRVKLSLQWSRLVVYLGGSDCFITCFVTDDITLKREGTKLSLIPTKYSTKDALFKSPKSVKAMLVGGDHSKGGFRLDKDRISPDDQHKFDDFSYIQITFKEAQYLNKFETLWNQMMDTRRRSRRKISHLRKEIEQKTYAPGYDV